MAERKGIFTKKIAESRYVEPRIEEEEKRPKLTSVREEVKSSSITTGGTTVPIRTHISTPRTTMVKSPKITLSSVLKEVLDEIGYDSSWIERLPGILKDIDRQIEELDRKREVLIAKREKIKRLLELLEMV